MKSSWDGEGQSEEASWSAGNNKGSLFIHLNLESRYLARKPAGMETLRGEWNGEDVIRWLRGPVFSWYDVVSQRWANGESPGKTRFEVGMNTVTTHWTKYGTSLPFSRPHKQVHNGLEPVHRPYTVFVPSSYRILICTTACTHPIIFTWWLNAPPCPSPRSTVSAKLTTRWTVAHHRLTGTMWQLI